MNSHEYFYLFIEYINMENLDFKLLTIFDSILAERSISRAANRLNLAQPTVSNALNRLRRITDDQLFVRTSSGMVPTPHAERMALPIRQAVATILTNLHAPRPFDPATSTRSFTIYMTDLGESFFLPTLLKHLRVEAPTVKINTLPMPDHNPQAALESGEVDIAIGSLPDLRTGFYQQRLILEHYIGILRPDHPLTKKRFTAKQFANASHAVVLPFGTGHGIVERTLINLGLQDRIMLRVQNFLVLPSIVANTDLIAIVPHSTASQLSTEYHICLIDIPVPLPQFDVKQCWHERFHADPGNQWLRNKIASLFVPN